MPFQEKLEFLYGLPARHKRDLILSAPDAERLVQSFAPQTLFYTLKEIGSADAGDLLSLALPEQVRWLIDLDCWEKDRPNLARMREWIEALSEGGRRRVAEALLALDIELVSLLLRRYVKVHRLDDPTIADDAPSNRFMQLDEHYLIEYIRADPILAHLIEFLEEAFERDYTYFTALMEEIYWGVEAELEEEAYQFRRARLADQGFPDYFEAQDVFAYLNPREFLKLRAGYLRPDRADLREDGETLAPGLAPAVAGADNSLFNTALTAGFSAQGKHQLRSEMAMVSNQVLVARAVDFGDLEAVRVAVATTHNYLNLGLEHLAGGDLGAAIEHLRDTHLKLLLRLGVSLTIDLRTRAQATMKSLGLDPARAREVSYLDSPYREALAAMLERQPRFFAGLEGGGAVTTRDFRSMRDLHMGYAMLDQIAAMADLLKTLLRIDIASPAFRAQAAGRDLQLSRILLTALARLAMDGRLGSEPIEAQRLGEMHRAIMTAERPAHLRPEFRAHVGELIAGAMGDSMSERSAAFVGACLNHLEEEMADVDPDAIDPRFIHCVLIRR